MIGQYFAERVDDLWRNGIQHIHINKMCDMDITGQVMGVQCVALVTGDGNSRDFMKNGVFDDLPAVFHIPDLFRAIKRKPVHMMHTCKYKQVKD